MLLIQITKRTGGGAVLRCARSDGSVAWQKQDGKYAAFFALHDLTHFAVESVLGYHQGFFGLIAEGWEISDTTGKGSRGPLPPETLEVETLVGLLDQERGSSAFWTVEEFNDAAALQASSTGHPAPRKLSVEDLAQVKAKRSQLFSRWFALPAGETLQLRFESVSRD
jgi:hypothetical protein